MKRISTLLCMLLCLTALYAQRADNYPPTKNAQVKLSETNLPIVFIDVDGKMILREERITAKIKIIDNGTGKTNYADLATHPDQKVDYEGYISLKYRGNSSFNSSDKKPYGFKTIAKPLEEGGKKVKVSLLGLGKDNDWVLLAPFADKSMIRDVLTFELGRPYLDWVPSSRHVEVVVDGKYYGIYILTERPGKGKNRLNLHDPGEDGGDLTGDWRVEIDRDDEDHYYRSKYHPYGRYGTVDNTKYITYQYDDPEYEDFADLPAGTEKAIQKSIDDMEDCFAGDNYKDPVNGYRKYIDVTSFIDYMLSTEFTFNVDGYRLSSHMYKYSETRAKNEGLDSRWKCTLWDFNIALGNADYYKGSRTDLWQYEMNSRETDNQLVPFWWKRLIDDPAYQTDLKTRWAQYREGQYADNRIDAKIDSLATLLTSGGAMERNEAAWGMFGRYVWPNAYVGYSFNDEISYLKRWIKNRLTFMDKKLLPQEKTDIRPVTVASGYNADVVVEALPASSHADNAGDGADNTFYSAGLKASGGLPTDGVVNAPSGVNFQLGDYAASNALVIKTGEGGDLIFGAPITTSQLYILATSGDGSSDLTATPLYSDGSQGEGIELTVADWSVKSLSGEEAISGLSRINKRTDTYSQSFAFCLFDHAIGTDKSRKLRGVRLTSTRGGRALVMGVAYKVVQTVGIDSPATGERKAVGYYTPNGVRIARPGSGITIIKYSDGSVKKIVAGRSCNN